MELRDGGHINMESASPVTRRNGPPMERQWQASQRFEELFGTFFRCGYVLDGLEEPTFKAKSESNRHPSWGNLLGIPPVLVARMRLAAPS